ncbi:hypothetical protein GCM10020220_058640 [Nonomuraea rubra]
MTSGTALTTGAAIGSASPTLTPATVTAHLAIIIPPRRERGPRYTPAARQWPTEPGIGRTSLPLSGTGLVADSLRRQLESDHALEACPAGDGLSAI